MYRSLMVETLHQTDQGVFKHMVIEVKKMLGCSQGIQILDDRLNIIKREYGVGSSLRLPSFGIWIKTASVQAHEYRSVMQVSIK